MLEAISTLVVATVLLLGSPGPVPIALAATGGVLGPRQGVPFLIGVLLGLAVAISFGSAGVVTLFNAFPSSRLVVGILGSLYICYIAVKIATAPVLSGDARPRSSPPRSAMDLF